MRINRIDQNQPVLYEVEVHDYPAEFLIKAKSTMNEDEKYEIKINGKKNLDRLRGRFLDHYSKIVDSLRIMNGQLCLLNPVS